MHFVIEYVRRQPEAVELTLLAHLYDDLMPGEDCVAKRLAIDVVRQDACNDCSGRKTGWRADDAQFLRVAGVMAAAKRSTMAALSCSSSDMAIRSTMTPCRCATYVQHKPPPSCSRFVVSTRSPADQRIASVVPRVINNSSGSHPNRVAARSRPVRPPTTRCSRLCHAPSARGWIRVRATRQACGRAPLSELHQASSY